MKKNLKKTFLRGKWHSNTKGRMWKQKYVGGINNIIQNRKKKVLKIVVLLGCWVFSCGWGWVSVLWCFPGWGSLCLCSGWSNWISSRWRATQCPVVGFEVSSAGSLKKQENSRKASISALLTMSKPLTVWITTNCGKFWKRWKYQTTWPASWETCMQVRKQQLELNMDQQTGSK